MAVKKKEKPPQSRQSETSGSRKVGNSAPMRSLDSKQGGNADKAKTHKTKASNPQKMKSGEEQKEAKQKAGNLPMMQSVLEAGEFLEEVRAEARKISWPERSQVIKETVNVLFLVALVTLFVWVFDLMVAKFVFAPLEHLGHLYGIGGAR
jgi:preprotein translocase subunit SecE